MKPHLRASIAYIASRLIQGMPVTGLFDRSQFRRVFLSGNVDRTLINVYDHERRCFIVGVGDGEYYSFFHQGEQCHIRLGIRGNAFWGHDYGRSTRFRGTVEDREITFHEDESDRQFRYTI